MTFSFDALRRWPDVEAPNLFAFDAADRLILDEAAEALGEISRGESGGGDIAIIGDRYGALTLAVASTYGLTGLRSHQDRLAGERALAANAAALALEGGYRSLPLGPELLRGARVVLLQLPRSLAELAVIAQAIARSASPDVIVYAGGRIKHLTVGMNDVLGASFETVTATRARQKSRVLIAATPKPTPGDDRALAPAVETHTDIGLTIVAYPGAFAGTSIDIGTRFLLPFLDQLPVDAGSAIDLGCGTGVIAAMLAKALPGATILATDQSQAAVDSARATAEANGLGDRIAVVRELGLAGQPDASCDVIVCNPPFHVGSTVHTGIAHELFRDAGRVLAPGGRLLTVFNSHLGYPAELRRLVGPTRVLGRNAKFTVTESIKR